MSDSRADFAALLAGGGMNYRRGFNPGEQVEARVISTRGNYAIVDVGAKDEGVVPKEFFTDDEGRLMGQTGETVTVWFVGMRQGNMVFTAKNKAQGRGESVVRKAFEAGTPIDGIVVSENKGGYQIDLAGERAFCPFSQMDIIRGKEASEYVGTRQTFLVTEYAEDERGLNILVSRRVLLERERKALREQLFAELGEGQTREGTVTRLADFGAFVDLGGAEGLIPLRELSWQRNIRPEEVVKVGDKVEVQVLHVDVGSERISLSLRALHENPWDVFVSQYREGDVLTAKILRIAPFGAFAQLMPGVDGLLSNGRLAALAKGRRIASAHEVVEEGQLLEVRVESIDERDHRIALRPVTQEEPKAELPGNDPDEDPTAWLKANASKNAAIGNNPFAGLSL